jgi:type II secretory ATPase GspE/PulE/Tfp pilus assembly ATPase PilB-like protein
LYGERAVVRLFSSVGQYVHLNDLGLSDDVRERLEQLLAETSGAILVTGPAGSGKTTTAYACLRHLVRSSDGGRSIVSLEDPIEVAVPGVAQSQANTAAGFGLASGLRSLMRQDPEVIMLGEIRDRETAEIAIQASLSGQLVITTFHAGSAAEAISRLADMGIEPYLLRSGVLGILSQRLVRRLCDCAVENTDYDARLGLPVQLSRVAVGCRECSGTGYAGRIALAEILVAGRGELGRAILSRMEAARLEKLAVESGMVTRWQRAVKAVEDGLTSAAEVRRVLGFSDRTV